MNDQDKALILECGSFCHLTTNEKAELIKQSGIDPQFDDSLVLGAGDQERAVYFCQELRINDALGFLGSRNGQEEFLHHFRVKAGVLANKNIGPDIGFLIGSYIEPAEHTIKRSLSIGSIACYDPIHTYELEYIGTLKNPHFIKQEIEEIPNEQGGGKVADATLGVCSTMTSASIRKSSGCKHHN